MNSFWLAGIGASGSKFEISATRGILRRSKPAMIIPSRLSSQPFPVGNWPICPEAQYRSASTPSSNEA
ncbi:Uncharacterised protein [Mycobacterium tuberculosis]|uniref:Uncharacterized protein n=1 Tax=Mycobacterium tuberculosis TaxID=1773 RepID=A0A916L9A8_MYCTX|nr:Uncharacterised protein [Mycobacterium tuberculosis]